MSLNTCRKHKYLGRFVRNGAFKWSFNERQARFKLQVRLCTHQFKVRLRNISLKIQAFFIRGPNALFWFCFLESSQSLGSSVDSCWSDEAEKYLKCLTVWPYFRGSQNWIPHFSKKEKKEGNACHLASCNLTQSCLSSCVCPTLTRT